MQRQALEQTAKQREMPEPPLNVPYFTAYDYFSIDLACVSDTHKAVKAHDGVVSVVERTVLEKRLLSNISIKDKEVRGLIDTAEIHRIIKEQAQSKANRISYSPKAREEQLVAQI